MLVGKKWIFRLENANRTGSKTVISNHLVQATGLGSSQPYLPPMEYHSLTQKPDSIPRNTVMRSYWKSSDSRARGIGTLISPVYLYQPTRKNCSLLGSFARSIADIGSANIAFYIIQNCHQAGFKTATVVLSPIYVFPYGFMMHHHGNGAHDVMPLDLGTLPIEC